MTGFIPDASLASAWCFSDEATPFTDGLLEAARAGDGLVVPVLWRHELANALLYGAKKGRITEQQIETFFRELGRLTIILDLESWERATGETRRLDMD